MIKHKRYCNFCKNKSIGYYNDVSIHLLLATQPFNRIYVCEDHKSFYSKIYDLKTYKYIEKD